MDQPATSPKPPPQRRHQFRLPTLLLAMALVSVPAALFGGFLRPGDQADDSSRLVLLTLMAPVGLMVLCGLLRFLLTTGKRRRKW
ncbi:MAG: hypothetical protein GTO53_10535 [Planctomycetales bacterium]|nr:hypothetical protein [Planctomycetales bacterium]NIM09558.1 hypothetical protein [Planctomycetales bacterium]NIN09046.1 hypothetical protein [Planctomycetales bacterium]NIN78159.1 hypothetical protein [Planctomycetales bacterium]NIO35344.1 hypothetical protein [Planctomycetales bacterium]